MSSVRVVTLRVEEEWARRIVGRHLRRPVSVHDDGSQEGLYDLRVGPSGMPDIAIEVSAAVDELRTKTWNTGPARGSWTISVPGNWVVTLAPEANIKKLRRELPALLEDLRAAGVTSYPVFEMIEWHHPSLYQSASDLGVVQVDEYESSGAGKIYFTMQGMGGAIDSDGLALPGWIGDFLRHDRRRDVLRKLAKATAPQREVFVPVTFDGAPWSVVSYLTDISATTFRVPAAAPDLPIPVTGVWVVSTASFGESVGVRWDGETWAVFKSRGADIDEETDPGVSGG